VGGEAGVWVGGGGHRLVPRLVLCASGTDQARYAVHMLFIRVLCPEVNWL
jgi:hypothetical protein